MKKFLLIFSLLFLCACGKPGKAKKSPPNQEGNWFRNSSDNYDKQYHQFQLSVDTMSSEKTIRVFFPVTDRNPMYGRILKTNKKWVLSIDNLHIQNCGNTRGSYGYNYCAITFRGLEQGSYLMEY